MATQRPVEIIAGKFSHRKLANRGLAQGPTRSFYFNLEGETAILSQCTQIVDDIVIAANDSQHLVQSCVRKCGKTLLQTNYDNMTFLCTRSWIIGPHHENKKNSPTKLKLTQIVEKNSFPLSKNTLDCL